MNIGDKEQMKGEWRRSACYLHHQSEDRTWICDPSKDYHTKQVLWFSKPSFSMNRKTLNPLEPNKNDLVGPINNRIRRNLNHFGLDIVKVYPNQESELEENGVIRKTRFQRRLKARHLTQERRKNRLESF